MCVCVQETKLHPTKRGGGGGGRGVELETCFKMIVREGGGERGAGRERRTRGGGEAENGQRERKYKLYTRKKTINQRKSTQL